MDRVFPATVYGTLLSGVVFLGRKFGNRAWINAVPRGQGLKVQREIAVESWLMTREAVRRAGISVLAVIGLIHAGHAAHVGPGNGPPGGASGFGGPQGGGYGSGFSSPGPRNPGYPPDRSPDRDGYDYSGPNFNFSVRKTHPSGAQKDNAETQDQKTPPANSNDNDIWDRFRSGFGLFGPEH